MAEAAIKLTRFPPKTPPPGPRRTAWPISILAEGTNIDDHIFVYHVGKPDDPIAGDKFECVASINQMQELPKTQGMSLTTTTGIPFYRHNELKFVARSALEAKRIWDEVVNEVHELVENWNASMVLQAAEFAEVSTEVKYSKGFVMTPPMRINLSYHPAGTPVVVNDKPGIDAPDTGRVGWLPVSLLGVSNTVPPGAVFYYNLTMDQNLASVWPPEVPYEGNQLIRNGLIMPYGVVWTITPEGLWWLDFDPATIPGYQRIDDQEADWGAPWPQDYATPSSPGAVPNILTLMLYKA